MNEDLHSQNTLSPYEPKMLKNLMTKKICQEIIQFHKSHRHLTGVGDGSDYTGIRFMHIQTSWLRNYVAEVIVNLTGEIRKISDQIVYPEMIAINEWPIGGIQSPHLDTYSNQEISWHKSRQTIKRMDLYIISK